jgi:hypothetical protein
MLRAITALSLIAALATTAAADPPRARIVQRNSDGTQRTVVPHRLPNPSMQSQFLPFDGPLSSKADSAVQPRLQTHVVIVQRPIVEPAATVGRALAQQPVWPDLVEVFLLGESSGSANTIYLHPDVDYENQGSLRLDRDHFINRAQRSANQMRRRPARIIWGAPHTEPADTADVAPAFILERPQPATPQRRNNADKPKFARSSD